MPGQAMVGAIQELQYMMKVYIEKMGVMLNRERVCVLCSLLSVLFSSFVPVE
jgi:hypothetical protein